MTNSYDYGIIGNCTSAALISSDCSIEWLCLPFFDSPSLFARILDKDKGGYFRLSAVDLVETEQSYVYHTAILKTIFRTKQGVFEVRDYMPRFHGVYGTTYCPSEIHRDIYVVSGRPQLVVQLDPRPNYAYSEARCSVEKDHTKITSHGGEYYSFYLYSNLDHAKIIAGEPIELKESSYLLLSYHEKLENVDRNKIFVEYE